MKNLLIGLFVLGLTSLGSAQNPEMDDEKVLALNMDNNAPTFKKNVSAFSTDNSYLSLVKEEATSNHVRFLEDKVSRCDVTKLSKFDGRSETFEVVFKANKGSIIATYDNKGNVLTTIERFKDVKIPVIVRNTVYQEYPGWTTHGNSYSVSYIKNEGAKKIYKIQIRKGNLKKKLKIDSEGNLI